MNYNYKRHCSVFWELKNELEKDRSYVISEKAAKQVEEAFKDASTDLPGLLPKFNLNNFLHDIESREYEGSPIRIAICRAFGILQAIINENASEELSDKETFDFILNLDLKRIVVRDYHEFLKNKENKCPKSALIMGGSVVEGILLDLLLRYYDKNGLPSGLSLNDLHRKDLDGYIKLASGLGKIEKTVQSLSATVKDWRNLIHPGKELRQKSKFNEHEVSTIAGIIKILIRDCKD